MKIYTEKDNLILQNVDSFDIEQILECGQFFHYDKLGDKEYVIVAMGRLLHIKQQSDRIIFFQTKRETFDTVWRKYFDLDRDYKHIKTWLLENERRILKKDGVLKDAILDKSGVRILNQEFFETLISFIISQNKQIPHIMQIVDLLSIKYGSFVGKVGDKEYYAFPTLEQLSKVSENEIRLCKAGFRAPYIVNACEKLLDGTVNEKRMLQGDFDAVMNELMLIKGVGGKVASCVALFSLEKRNAFPIDVWVKRVMEKIYFEGETSKNDIEVLAKKIYGEYGGYAQQYLFYYGRENNLRTDVSQD